jgi:hypothetical protein
MSALAILRKPRRIDNSELPTIRSGTHVLREITSSVALGDQELISFQCHLDALGYVEDTVFQSCRIS